LERRDAGTRRAHDGTGARFGAGDGEASPLLRHERDYYLGWVRRTWLFASRLRDRYPWLESLCARGEELVEPLLEAVPCVIHGDFAPHNILVRGDALVAVDWQSAAVACGALDVATLTDAAPAPAARAAEQAYVAARWPGAAPADFQHALDAARIHLHFRWLGDRPRWTVAQRNEWRFEQLRQLTEQFVPA